MNAVFRRAAGAAALLLCAMPGAAWADGYFSPTALPSNNVLWSQTSGAGTSINEPLTPPDNGTCDVDGPQVINTHWYSFKGTGGPMLLTSVGSDFDTLIGFYNAPAPAQIDADTFCSNDRASDDPASQIELSTTEAGKTYLLQVGGCDDSLNAGTCPFSAFGQSGTAFFAAVGNDSRSFPETIPADTPLTRTNAGASTEGGESTSCAGAPFGKSVWFRFNAPAAGTATFESVGFDTVVNAYRLGGSKVGCNDNTGDSNTSRVRVHVTTGSYLVQVGGKGTGEDALFGNFRYSVSFTPDPKPTPTPVPTSTPVTDPDTDRDGVPDRLDCAPTDPARHVGLKEILGNKVDEDCDGKAQDFPEVKAHRGEVNYVATASTKLSSFVVNKLAKGDKVTITCKGKGCRTKRVVKKFGKAKSQYDFIKKLRRNRPRPGAVIEVRVTHARRIGHVWRYTFRFYKAPKLKEDLCVRPGASKAKPCS
jgi:hypothetical protein